MSFGAAHGNWPFGLVEAYDLLGRRVRLWKRLGYSSCAAWPVALMMDRGLTACLICGGVLRGILVMIRLSLASCTDHYQSVRAHSVYDWLFDGLWGFEEAIWELEGMWLR